MPDHDSETMALRAECDVLRQDVLRQESRSSAYWSRLAAERRRVRTLEASLRQLRGMVGDAPQTIALIDAALAAAKLP